MAAAQGKVEWYPPAVGFLMGVFFLLLLDKLIPHLHAFSNKPEGLHSHLRKNTMLVLAVTLHNIPEGMAVGVVFAGLLNNNSLITASGAFALSIGIAIQNFPEGAIISMPLKANGGSKAKSFVYGTLSGIVEPIAGALTILLTQLISGLLPYFLSFAAGAMIYVVVEELVPESQNGDHTDFATIAVAIGFVVMMVLDVALG
jgi:ZIP family zinc transporter